MGENPVLKWLDRMGVECQQLVFGGFRLSDANMTKGAQLEAIRYLRRELQALAETVKAS